MYHASLFRRSALSGIAVLVTLGIAHADLKIVQKASFDGPNLGGLGGAPAAKAGDIPTVTYYKGTRTRTEDAAGVTITDTEAGTITKLDLKKKTYATIKMAELTKSMAGAGDAGGFLEMIDMKIKADVKPGGHSKEILGKKTSDWLWTAKIGMAMKGSDPDAEGGELASISIEGEQWTSEEVTLPTTSKTPTNATAGLPGLGSGMGGMFGLMLKNPSMKSLTDKMATIKGFPLLMSMKMTVKSPIAEAQGMDIKKPIVIKSEVTEVSQEELSDTLFAIPDGFKKVPYEVPQLALPGGAG